MGGVLPAMNIGASTRNRDVVKTALLRVSHSLSNMRRTEGNRPIVVRIVRQPAVLRSLDNVVTGQRSTRPRAEVTSSWVFHTDFRRL